MNDTELDRILSKIKKCLALGESSEPAEAAAAMRQAQKLMVKYGIDQSTMELADIGEAEVRSRVSVSRIKPWEGRVFGLVAKAFGCKLVWTKSNSYNSNVFGRFRLIGLKTQVKLAEYTATVLMRKLIKARLDFMATLPSWLDRQEKGLRGDGFAIGWVEAIEPTVHAFADYDKLKPAIDQYVAKQIGELGRTKMRRMSYSEAAADHGRLAGAGVSLHHAVDGANQRLLR